MLAPGRITSDAGQVLSSSPAAQDAVYEVDYYVQALEMMHPSKMWEVLIYGWASELAPALQASSTVTDDKTSLDIFKDNLHKVCALKIAPPRGTLPQLGAEALLALDAAEQPSSTANDTQDMHCALGKL